MVNVSRSIGRPLSTDWDMKLSRSKCAITHSTDNHSELDDGKKCQLPNLDPFRSYVVKAINPVESIDCEGRLYTEYENSVFKLLDDVDEKHQIQEVFAVPIVRVSDQYSAYGEKTFLSLNNRSAIMVDDFLRVTIRFRDGSEQTDFHASISEIPEVSEQKETRSSPLNIMILAFDGTSAAHFERMLPKTYTYLKDNLESIMVKGYSVVGESTTPQLTALLTGRSLEENCDFSEARKEYASSTFVDVWPFIYKDLKRLGIVTMWSEDDYHIGTFTLRLNGFNDQPTDHYGRTLWLTTPGELCFNSQQQYKVQLKYLKSYMKSYPGKRKFGFTFFSDLCHREPGLVHAADSGITAFFESLQRENLLNDTLFITMSDHGARFEEVRQSPQGKLEQRLPFLSLTFPSWFKRSYPDQIAALVKNTRIISSPFDLHKTIKHLLAFPKKHFIETNTTGKSFFEPYSISRTCSDTGIPEYYCPCLKWHPISISHPHATEAVRVAVDHINKLLMSHPMTAKLCHQLKLKMIAEAYQSQPSSETHLTLDLEQTICTYQIQFQTTPGDGIFEGLVRMDLSGNFKVYSKLDRINMYGDQPRCIYDAVPSIRSYCLCK